MEVVKNSEAHVLWDELMLSIDENTKIKNVCNLHIMDNIIKQIHSSFSSPPLSPSASSIISQPVFSKSEF